MTAPERCTFCGEVTDEVNVSFNLSRRELVGEKVQFTSDTEYAASDSELIAIGSYCPDCDKEWIDPKHVAEFTDFLLSLPANNPKEAQ